MDLLTPRLDQRITLRAPTRTADGAGGFETAWGDFASVPQVWAKVEYKAGREVMAEGRVTATGTYHFTIRNREDVFETHGILWRGEHYNIRAVNRFGQRELFLTLEAERGAPR